MGTEDRLYFVHPTSCIDEPVEIGPGTKVWHFCHVMKGARIGEGCILGQNIFVAGTVVMGDRVKVQNNVSLYDGVQVEDECFLGPSMVFTNVMNPRSFIERKAEFRLTLVRRGATIGANATVICGVTIGRYAFVGAGAVVREDVPDYGLALGVPAQLRGWMCRCGVRLAFSHHGSHERAHCAACGAAYSKVGSSVQERIDARKEALR